jgi:acetoin utilization protein AcuB
MNVENVMTREVVTLEPENSLRDAVNEVQRNRIRHIPIVEGKRLVGMVTDRDIKRATPSVHGGATQDDFNRTLDDLKLSQVMTRDPLYVRPNTSLKDALALLIDRRYGALPVVDGDELVGIISDIDLLRILHSML